MTDWSRLSHAYGKAVDTPNLIARLQGDGWEEALGDLYASILHQGTIYTATLPAIAELVQVVLNPTAQARVGAACLVADYADSVRVGWAHNPNYLPKKLNLAKFEAEAITALAEAVTALTPCLPDPDSDIRQYVAVLCQRTANLPAATEEALHKQLAVETDPAVITALIAAVQAHDGLTNDEAVRLQDATPDARFAQAATALLKGPMTPSAVATAVELWNDCTADFQQTGVSDALVDDIVAADWASAIPLLNGLAHQGGVALVDAIQGFYNLRWYRSATSEALNGLLDIAARAADTPGIDEPISDRYDDSARNLLVYALAEFAPAVTTPAPAGIAPTDLRQRFCDALYDTATSGSRIVWQAPSFARGRPPDVRDIRADVLEPLMEVDDARWIDLLAAVMADATGPVMVGGFRSRWGLSALVERCLADHPCSPDAGRRLAGLLADKLRQGQTDWLKVVAKIPADVASLRDAVVSLINTAPLTIDIPDFGQRDNTFLQGCVPLLINWQATEAVPRLTELAKADWGQAPLAALALQGITGNSDVDNIVARRGLPQYFEEEFLQLWANMPTSSLVPTAVAQVGDEPDVSFPGRSRQLAAARIAADAGRLDDVWPVVLAVVAAQESPMADAVETAISLAGADEARRSELAQLLTSIAASPAKLRWSDNATTAPVTAWDGLVKLGVPVEAATGAAVLKLLTALGKNAGYDIRSVAVPIACELAVAVANSEPEQADSIARKLQAIINADTRLPVISNPVKLDCAVLPVLQTALTAMLGD